ncbi:probable 4-methylmuconolactone transporter isoform X2 [Artemia franciscana]|uniref:Major facilitator superfamily (MFS) profile domain-containing protein n=2 Tax=Artemia franciscana TaxID=6661 RepID=A0AA88L5M5_ARTSF|nr:hypothetical protein QYM36_009603 [Artemia franciscana]KAK2713774.1 hypothetical protein QYM36_009603 [Artemia franciscana]KAK2713775.1 hypothetical protein QYM36_009603 [Artemia franciscana]KAK2713776.1 hypothetical protein QYM36_009603 [Artemia franciscana]
MVEAKWWYLVSLLTCSYIFGELSHFLIGIVSRPIAQELEYGDQSCLQALPYPTDNQTRCDQVSTETECVGQVTGSLNASVCTWTFNGQGLEYQILAGPSFIFAFTIAGVFIGFAADRYNRKNLLAIATIVFSAATLLTGFSQEFWHLIILRMLLAVGESACQPVSAGLVNDIFDDRLRGVAMGIINLGIYIGYGLSYAFGNYITAANILDMGWRWSYIISGIPGFFIAVLLLFTAREPSRRASETDSSKEKEVKRRNIKDVVFQFFRPVILLLCTAASVRHTAGYCWAYSTQMFYDTYHPGVDIGTWMTLVSIFGGSFGIIAGGFVSDRVVSKVGLHARAWVLGLSQLLAAPFAIGVLLLPAPYTFISLLISYIFAETWFGILFAVLVEVLPSYMSSTTIGVFLFIMNNVGGNLPVIVEPLKQLMGFRGALLLLYPGFYIISALLFIFAGFSLRGSAMADDQEKQVPEALMEPISGNE